MKAEFYGFHGTIEAEVSITRTDSGAEFVEVPRSPCGVECQCGGWTAGRLEDGRTIAPSGQVYPD